MNQRAEYKEVTKEQQDRIEIITRDKSYLSIGNIKIETDKKFNRFQKFMWGKCFNIKVENVKE